MSETLEHGDTILYLCEPLESQVIGYTLAEWRSLAAALSQFPLKGAEGLIKDGVLQAYEPRECEQSGMKTCVCRGLLLACIGALGSKKRLD